MDLEFDWDQWNVQKNESKHGISTLDAESLFYDPYLIIFMDKVHSTKTEKRWIAFGIGLTNKLLMCAFTIRDKKIRIISCRAASKNERGIYEKEKISRDKRLR